jgi:hypothetical protein
MLSGGAISIAWDVGRGVVGPGGVVVVVHHVLPIVAELLVLDILLILEIP